MTRPLLLVIDDAPEIGLIVQILGKRAGQEIVCRPSAESAWEFLQQARPDLILLDLNLPGASGWDFCRRVRGVPPLADLPVALFSHWERPQDIAQGLEAGADYVVSKDLLCDDDAWRHRLEEILTPADGRSALLSLSWKNTQPVAPRRLAQLLNQALQLGLHGQVGAEVVRVVLRRVAQRHRLNDCLRPDGLGVDVERVGQQAAPEGVALFARALVEQVWCLLGTAASAPFRDALAGDNPAFPGCPTRT